MQAGSLDRRITFERGTPTTDDYGGQTETWATITRAWAAVLYGTMQERREASQTSASQAAIFRVQSNSKTRSVTVEDRIIFDGSAWNITGAASPSRDRREFSAVRKVG